MKKVKISLIEFLNSISNWSYNLNQGIFEYNFNNLETIDERLKYIANDYQSVNNSSGKVQLIVEDDLLVKSCSEAVLAFMKVHFYVDQSLKKLKRILISEKQNTDLIMKEGKDFWRPENELRLYALQISEANKKEREELENEFPKKNQEMLLLAIQKRNAFVGLAKEFIQRGLKHRA